MSEVILELVEEFFQQRKYFTARSGNLVLIRKTKNEDNSDTGFILDEMSAEHICTAIVKPIAWHTCKITTRVLETFPEILEFAKENQEKKLLEWFRGENFKKILVIPQLPAHIDLRQKVLEKLQGTGINHLITIPVILTGVINKIEPRKVYSSPICDLLRVLKFYKLISISQEQMELPLR
ncbi:MAG TPA: hypothetical protein PK303_02665 [bacterium]|nr:hypothetical protein [bacterium]HOL34329.1 hypothetical protein [bacterium]HPP08009.1 hypothetical protein [bacterium]